MENLPANTETQEAQMSDVARARGLVVEIAGHCWTGKGDMLDRVHREIERRFPGWTRRRVRSIWHREAASIRYHEMIELASVADAVEADRRALEQARAEHAEFISQTARLAARLERQDEDFHGGHIEALRRLSCGVDRAGDRR